FFFFFQAEDGIRDATVTGVQTCALPILHLHPTFGLGSDGSRGVVGIHTDDRDRLAIDAAHRHCAAYGLDSDRARLHDVSQWVDEIGRASCREGVMIGGGGRVR